MSVKKTSSILFLFQILSGDSFSDTENLVSLDLVLRICFNGTEITEKKQDLCHVKASQEVGWKT